jgi:hypothetical protein
MEQGDTSSAPPVHRDYMKIAGQLSREGSSVLGGSANVLV